jgi:poly(A) polymerase
MGHRWWRMASADEARARRLLYRLGETNYRDRLLLAWARAGYYDRDAPRWCELAQLPERFKPPKFPLKAADFMARGVAEGPLLGHVLTLAEDAWLAADFPLDQASLDAIADQAAARILQNGRS